MSAKPVQLLYWKIPGRASLAHVLLEAAGIDHVFDDTDAEKETFKDKAPFGQLPILFDEANGVSMAQSSAIAIYCARLAGLDGKGDLRLYADCLQYIELEHELTQFLGRALYTGEKGSPERTKAWADAKTKIATKLDRATANLGEKKWISGSEAPTAADYALATILWLVSLPTLFPELQAEYAALNQHYKRVLEVSPAAAKCYEAMATWEQYYTRE